MTSLKRTSVNSCLFKLILTSCRDSKAEVLSLNGPLREKLAFLSLGVPLGVPQF